MKILWISYCIALGLSLEITACSFLQRYGVNSYITNIPLFFKKQSEFAPQAKPIKYKRGRRVMVADPLDIETEPVASLEVGKNPQVAALAQTSVLSVEQENRDTNNDVDLIQN